jgi:hypothetical protein
MTILYWPRSDADGRPGWLAVHWEPNRSAPFDAKWGRTQSEALARIA